MVKSVVVSIFSYWRRRFLLDPSDISSLLNRPQSWETKKKDTGMRMTGHGGTIVGHVFFFSFKTKLETREE